MNFLVAKPTQKTRKSNSNTLLPFKITFSSERLCAHIEVLQVYVWNLKNTCRTILNKYCVLQQEARGGPEISVHPAVVMVFKHHLLPTGSAFSEARWIFSGSPAVLSSVCIASHNAFSSVPLFPPSFLSLPRPSPLCSLYPFILLSFSFPLFLIFISFPSLSRFPCLLPSWSFLPLSFPFPVPPTLPAFTVFCTRDRVIIFHYFLTSTLSHNFWLIYATPNTHGFLLHIFFQQIPFP